MLATLVLTAAALGAQSLALVPAVGRTSRRGAMAATALAAAAADDDAPVGKACACGSNKAYVSCCRPLHKNAGARVAAGAREVLGVCRARGRLRDGHDASVQRRLRRGPRRVARQGAGFRARVHVCRPRGLRRSRARRRPDVDHVDGAAQGAGRPRRRPSRGDQGLCGAVHLRAERGGRLFIRRGRPRLRAEEPPGRRASTPSPRRPSARRPPRPPPRPRPSCGKLPTTGSTLRRRRRRGAGAGAWAAMRARGTGARRRRPGCGPGRWGCRP